MHNAKFINKIFSLLVIFLLTVVVLAPISAVRVYARTAEEIQKEIDAKQKEINSLQSDLAKKQSDLAKANSQKQSAQNELASVQSDIESKKIEIEVIQLELDQLQANYEVQKLEKEQIERQQTEQLSSLYMNWKGNIELNSILTGNNDPIKQNYYLEIITETDQEGLNATYEKLAGLETDIKDVEAKREELNKKKADLESQKQTLESTVASLSKQTNSYSSNIQQLQPKLANKQLELQLLSAEQKSVLDNEDKVISDKTTVGTKPLENGAYYFSGMGRDKKQGHGVGMSQYGAYGAAKQGWTAQQILEFYYTGAKVVNYGESSMITIWYCPNSPRTYTPPNCNGVNPVQKRISLNDYLGGLGEVPESWPIEARKAQMIAARTYALKQTNNGATNKPICITTSCQVSYIRAGYTDEDFMENGDYQIAIDTQGKVVTYQGALISALYSSDNNQGWGTADNDTVFSNYSGSGTPYAYLRAKNDMSIAYRTSWSLWTYRTNGYTLTELDSFLLFAGSSLNTSSDSGSRNFMASLKTSIGTLQSIEFVRDSSGRVKKIKLTGTKGSKYMAGWLFKSQWNFWIDKVKPSGQYDYIYSLTFSMLKK